MKKIQEFLKKSNKNYFNISPNQWFPAHFLGSEVGTVFSTLLIGTGMESAGPVWISDST